MRILLAPHTGLKNIRGDSNYLLFLDTARYFVERGHFVHMIMPEYARDRVDHMPGLMYHYCDYSYDFYTEYAVHEPRFLVDTFSRRVGKYPIDTVILAKAMQVPIFRSLLSDVLRCKDIECYVVEPGVFEEKERGITKGAMQLMLTSMGYATATSVFLSPKEKVLAMGTASRWLSPAVLKQMDENSLVLPVGVPCDYIDEATKGIEKYDKFTLFFGGRLNSVKQPAKIFEVFSDFYSYGRTDVQVKVTSNTIETKFFTDIKNKEAMQGNESLIDIHFSCPREEYVKVAKASHVGMCWSTEEGFPVGFWEQMYMGLPVLFPDREWARRQLPDDYPWIYKDKYQAYSMIDYIKDHYDEVMEQMKPLREFIRDRYNDKIIYGTLEDSMNEKLSTKLSYVIAKSLVKLALDSAKAFGDEPFNLTQLLKIMQKMGEAFNANPRARMSTAKFPSDYDIYRCMLANGYKDLCNKAVPVFVKEELYEKYRKSWINKENA